MNEPMVTIQSFQVTLETARLLSLISTTGRRALREAARKAVEEYEENHPNFHLDTNILGVVNIRDRRGGDQIVACFYGAEARVRAQECMKVLNDA